MGKAAAKKRQRAIDEATLPNPIADGAVISGLLYLGPVSTASNQSYLRSQQISHIISVGRSPSETFKSIDAPGCGPRPLTYHRFALPDTVDADIRSCVHKACKIIDSAAAAGERVFIHCVAAISRSPMIVAAYLMRHRGQTLAESLATIARVRPVISPNRGFLMQLALMEVEVFGEQKSFEVHLRGEKVVLRLETEKGRDLAESTHTEMSAASQAVELPS
jgi:predicted protein tyrosine phosphatase